MIYFLEVFTKVTFINMYSINIFQVFIVIGVEPLNILIIINNDISQLMPQFTKLF